MTTGERESLKTDDAGTDAPELYDGHAYIVVGACVWLKTTGARLKACENKFG